MEGNPNRAWRLNFVLIFKDDFNEQQPPRVLIGTTVHAYGSKITRNGRNNRVAAVLALIVSRGNTHRVYLSLFRPIAFTIHTEHIIYVHYNIIRASRDLQPSAEWILRDTRTRTNKKKKRSRTADSVFKRRQRRRTSTEHDAVSHTLIYVLHVRL